jgi:nucleotide-binding universal stress UspA family protein
MERILLILHAHHPDLATIDFGCRIAALDKRRVTGLFLESIYDEVFADGQLRDDKRKVVKNYVRSDVDQSIRIFMDECRLKGVAADVIHLEGEPLTHIIRESQFADLVILGAGLSFIDDDDEYPSPLARNVLLEARCPVLLAPQQAGAIEEVVFCYDGSKSALFALKQFTYLFPTLSDTKATLLEIGGSEAQQPFDENHRTLLQWLRGHYREVYYERLQDAAQEAAKEALFQYFFMKEKKLVVMGAYGRGLISSLFRSSAADPLIRNTDLPLFITHL